MQTQISTLRMQELRMRRFFEKQQQILPPTSTKFASRKRGSAAAMIASIEHTLQRNSSSMKRLTRMDTNLSSKSGGTVSSSEVLTPKAKKRAKVEDFELKNKIGAGTFGVIVRAIERKTQKEYAVKKIDKTRIQTR